MRIISVPSKSKQDDIPFRPE